MDVREQGVLICGRKLVNFVNFWCFWIIFTNLIENVNEKLRLILFFKFIFLFFWRIIPKTQTSIFVEIVKIYSEIPKNSWKSLILGHLRASLLICSSKLAKFVWNHQWQIPVSKSAIYTTDEQREIVWCFPLIHFISTILC